MGIIAKKTAKIRRLQFSYIEYILSNLTENRANVKYILPILEKDRPIE